MAFAARKYQITWPLVAESAVQIDEMFDELYKLLGNSVLGGSGSLTLSSETKGSLLHISDTSGTVDGLPAVATGSVLISQGLTTVPAWGTAPVIGGGTGLTSYAVGDLLYADTTTSLARLADVATGNALISGGIGAAPSYGKIALTTHVSGVLPIANGGTNNSSAYTAGSVVFSDGTKLTQDNTNFFWDDSNNRLGIKTATPGASLEVANTTFGQLFLRATTALGSCALECKTVEGTPFQLFASGGGATSAVSLVLNSSNIFSASPTSTAIVAAAGANTLTVTDRELLMSTPVNSGLNMSITNGSSGGVASATINVINNSATQGNFSIFGSGVGFSQFGQVLANWVTLTTTGASGNGMIIGTRTADPVLFGTNDTERVRILSTGEVGIGTTSPEALLEIQGAEATDAVLCLDADDGDDNADTWFIKSVASDNDLDFVNHTTVVATLSSAGDLTVAGSAGNIGWGTYTPTRSAEANLDANVTPQQAQYMRVGNTVTVSGRVTAVDPTAPATATSYELSLPVASNLGAAEDLAGVAFCGAIAGQGAEITGSVANNTAVVSWVSGDVTSQAWSFTFSYQVI